MAIDLSKLTEKDLENMSEDELKQVAAALDVEENSTSYGSPDAPDKDSIFKFYRQLLDKLDSSKIANLDKLELGRSRLPVRAYQEIANYADNAGLDLVGTYLRNKAEITLATSMSKAGFLAELFVTTIRKHKNLNNNQTRTEKGLFGNKKTVVEGVDTFGNQN